MIGVKETCPAQLISYRLGNVSLVDDRFCNNISAVLDDDERSYEGDDGETIQICTELCHNAFWCTLDRLAVVWVEMGLAWYGSNSNAWEQDDDSIGACITSRHSLGSWATLICALLVLDDGSIISSLTPSFIIFY